MDDDPALALAFDMVSDLQERDAERYNAIIEKRREAGRKGGRKRQQNAEQRQANAGKGEQNKPTPIPTPTPILSPKPSRRHGERESGGSGWIRERRRHGFSADANIC